MTKVSGTTIRTFTITGTGLTVGTIGGVNYLTVGLLDAITISENGTNLYCFSSLGLAGSVPGTAIRQDARGTSTSALENLFRSLTYTLFGADGADPHLFGASPEAPSIALTFGGVCVLFGGDNKVVAAKNRTDTLFGGSGNDTLQGNGGSDSIDSGLYSDLLCDGFCLAAPVRTRSLAFREITTLVAMRTATNLPAKRVTTARPGASVMTAYRAAPQVAA